MKVKSVFQAIFLGMLMVFSLSLNAQKRNDVVVDKNGVMRWPDGKEVYGFGVNYTTPFAHAYRTAKKLNIDIEKAIDDDVYHMSRLGFDAFRVHVWDTEISDTLGNLIENENLRLFDYLLMRLKERGIKILITPIAFWGNGWPEPDEKTPGFSFKYGKDNCLTNPEAIKAQENYLYQFLNHVNPYTKIAYKSDPDIVAFEISNEPHHRGTPAEVANYIKRMVASMKRTGCKKPIFYNVTHSIQLSQAYYDAGIDGGTFQWYPTGLGSRHELRGNLLPNVDQYIIPFANETGFKKGAKVVYEFDAADVNRSYIYPAMARSFREAGMQWATHFAYDPTFMAFANTEYNTHYMNLVYAPQKALSLKIAGEVFHQVPRYKQYGRYPTNTTFENFMISYEKDLSELNTDSKFFYTNHTTTSPKNQSRLIEVAGTGNSPVVKYEGTGAYFLDKLENGVWRLEVFPDVIWIDNIFGRNSLKKEVALINHREWPMEIALVDLTNDFEVSIINSVLRHVQVSKGKLLVTPGVYVLKKGGITTAVSAETSFKNNKVGDFVDHPSTVKDIKVIHEPHTMVAANTEVKVNAMVVAKDFPQRVTLTAYYGDETLTFEMKKESGYVYSAGIPAAAVKEGYLYYLITVYNTDNSILTFPSKVKGTPADWDFYGTAYKSAVVKTDAPVYLFNAHTDADEVSKDWKRGSRLMPASAPESSVQIIHIDKLFTPDPENVNAKPIHDYSLRYNFIPKIKGVKSLLSGKKKIVIEGYGINKSFPIQIALLDDKGHAFGAIVNLTPDKKEYALDLAALKPVKLITLPRPYPTFLPYYFEAADQASFDVNAIESIQLSVGPQLSETDGEYVYAIKSIRLE